MTLKLGQAVRDPLTGARGEVVRFIGETAICRAYNGTNFRLVGRGKYRKKKLECRILEFPTWLACERVTNSRIKITAPDPVWEGCTLSTSEVELREAREVA